MIENFVQILKDVLDDDNLLEINPDTNLENDLGMDIWDIDLLHLYLEDEYSVSIPDEAEFPTVGSLIKFISDSLEIESSENSIT